MTLVGSPYDGLLADIYDDYTSADFRSDLDIWDRLATDCARPALELACGTGRVLLPLVAAGHMVEGLDNSADMLSRCRTLAAEKGLAPVLHQADMAKFTLGQRFGLIICAAGSLTLMAGPAQMEAALDRARAHLEPGGLLALAMDAPGPRPKGSVVVRDLQRVSDGAHLRCILDPLLHENPEVARWQMTNEITVPGSPTRRATAEIAFRRPEPSRFADMLRAAGFGAVEFRNPAGSDAMREGDETYLVLARHG